MTNVFDLPAVVSPTPDSQQPEVVAAALPSTDIIEQLTRVRNEVARRELARLDVFIRQAWALVEPVIPLVWNWHIEALCKLLEDVSAGKVKRLLINVPPGTMKSLLISVFWPAWEWTTRPELRYLTASYSGHLTTRDNLKLRNIVQSPWYNELFHLSLVDDQNQKTLFKTAEGGWRIATSVGGPGTGEHPDRIIIDDPLTAEQARSAVERDNANAWFDQTISTRGVTRDTTIIVVMQRLHEDDLAGHLLERGGWERVCWPMRYEVARASDPTWRPDPRDQRTEAGELLWPALFTEERVRKLELDLGPYGTAGQLQQRPAPEGGGLFKREWFRFVDVAPVQARRARGWDTAATAGGGDATAGVRIAELDGTFYVEDVRHERLGPAGVDALIRQTAVADGPKCAQREEKEGGSAGKTVIDARTKMLVGYDYRGVQISGDKVTRAKPFRAQVEGGNVCLVRGDWNEAYIRELCEFPTGKHDDRVDASSCAFNAVLLDQPKRVQTEATWGR